MGDAPACEEKKEVHDQTFGQPCRVIRRLFTVRRPEPPKLHSSTGCGSRRLQWQGFAIVIEVECEDSPLRHRTIYKHTVDIYRIESLEPDNPPKTLPAQFNAMWREGGIERVPVIIVQADPVVSNCDAMNWRWRNAIGHQNRLPLNVDFDKPAMIGFCSPSITDSLDRVHDRLKERQQTLRGR
jgi:hypothetical protein